METFLVYTFIGLTTAAIYAVIASGLVLTYTTTGVFNFAHGAIGMLAAFAYWQMHEAWHWPTLVAVLVDLLVLGPLMGLFLERVIMRGLGGTSEATKLVVSISLLVAMIGLANVLWNPDVGRTVYPFFNGKKIRLGPTALSYHQLITIIVAILVALGLRLLLTRSRLGVTMRAVVDDPALTQLNGAHPTRVAQFSWAIGCSLAALGGVLVVSSTVLNASGPGAAHRQRLRRGHLRAAALAAAHVRGGHHPRPRRRLPAWLPAAERLPHRAPAGRAGHPPVHRAAGHAQPAAAHARPHA